MFLLHYKPTRLWNWKQFWPKAVGWPFHHSSNMERSMHISQYWYVIQGHFISAETDTDIKKKENYVFLIHKRNVDIYNVYTLYQRCHRYYPKFPELYSRRINSLINNCTKIPDWTLKYGIIAILMFNKGILIHFPFFQTFSPFLINYFYLDTLFHFSWSSFFLSQISWFQEISWKVASLMYTCTNIIILVFCILLNRVWWPMFGLIFLFLTPVPLVIGKRSLASSETEAKSSACFEFCIFLMTGCILWAYGLPALLAHAGTVRQSLFPLWRKFHEFWEIK